MRVGILGPLEVSAGEGAVEIGGARLRVLLARLAVAVGRVVTVDELADALWSEDVPLDRVNSVRTLVSRLRRVLPDASVLVSTPGGYRLDLPADAVDAHKFDRLAREGRRALTDGDPATAARVLREALALWRGPALMDAPEVATAYVAGLEETRLSATEDCAEAELAAGDHAHLVAELSELAARYPLRERLQGLLLRALCVAGRHAEALAAYEDVRRRLADELGADPGPELREIHQEILLAEPQPRTQGGNLRTALTSFVGRNEELSRVGTLLTEGRLVTLVGPGGAGKTRLATTVAARLHGGAWLAELASVTDPADVPQAVLGALGSRDIRALDNKVAPRDSVSRLIEMLSRSDTVIVLDNCEHVIDAAARLADELLGRCPKLRILATSREPLGVFGETLCPVPPLSVPEQGATFAQAAASPAVRLLTDRAAAVRPGFEVTDENVTAVAEICRRLDGLPLAIELAAARLRTLTAPQLAARLDDRFRLLTGGSRTALPRHQTLRAVVTWSWDLLDDDERWFAERLAVFPASISLEAAEHVSPSALDLLTALADKSLLQVIEGVEPRYRMLETIREYALERLAGSGQIAAARVVHATYFRDLAETAEPYLRTADQLIWIAKLTAERDNILAALHFAADSGDADTAVRLAAALSMFWSIQGNRAESVGWMRLALEVPGDSPLEARTITSAMYLINNALAGGYARLDEIIEHFQVAAAAADSAPEHPVLTLLEPMLCLFLDDKDLGLAAVDKRSSHPDPWTRAMLWMLRGAMLENDGDMTGMRRDMTIATERFREVGDRFGLSQSLSSLAEAHLLFGDFDEAIAALEESIKLHRELDPDDDAPHERLMLASTRAQNGDIERARAEFESMTQPVDREWSARKVAFARVALGDIARHEGNLDEAARQYEGAAATIHDAPFVAPQFRAMILASMAHLEVDRGDPAAAGLLAEEAVEHALEAKDMPVLARVGVSVAAMWAGLGDEIRAAQVLGACEQLRGAPDLHNADIARLGRRLHGDACAAAYAHGRDLDRKAAIDQVRRR